MTLDTKKKQTTTHNAYYTLVLQTPVVSELIWVNPLLDLFLPSSLHCQTQNHMCSPCVLAFASTLFFSDGEDRLEGTDLSCLMLFTLRGDLFMFIAVW